MSAAGEMVEAAARARNEDRPPSRTGGARRPPRPHRDDQEFLAADLAILETPPSPARLALVWFICLLTVAVLTWSYFGQIDIIATAQGKLQPAGRVKVIQPLDAGKIAALRVANGAVVKAGDVLVELERGDAVAEEREAKAMLAGYNAESARRRTAIETASRRETVGSQIPFDTDLPAETTAREQQVLDSDMAQLKAQVDSVDAQIHEKSALRDHSQATIDAQTALIETLKQRVEMRATTAKTGSGSKANLLDAIESLQNQQTTLETQKGQLSDAVEAIAVLKADREKAFATFISDNAEKLAEARRQIDDLEQKVAKARLKTKRTALVSPIDGIVGGLTISTIGQVVSSGDEIMRIVPQDAPLEIECYLENRDIGFVRPGQRAVVKIEAFPFTRYGSVAATVVRVARDAIPQPDAQQTEGDPNRAARSSTIFAGAQRVQNLYFPVTLAPERTDIDVDGRRVDLSSGMAVTVEVVTGRRRILEYLFSPIVEVGARAFRER